MRWKTNSTLQTLFSKILHTFAVLDRRSGASVSRKRTVISSLIKRLVSRCSFCKLRKNFGFFCFVNHLNRPLRKQMFTCDWCISIHSAYFGALVIALFRAIIEYFSSKILLIFLNLVSCKNKAMSASCSRQTFHSSSRFPKLLYLSSLESFSVLFLRAKLGECVALSFALTPPPRK